MPLFRMISFTVMLPVEIETLPPVLLLASLYPVLAEPFTLLFIFALLLIEIFVSAP
ncbi:MAG: hypothetical protein US51_C0047G0007 [Microgenomates group bacterium GW2011_GWA2_37_6]|nr:MAG: hypothetical protein US51_C0047G0007 [Microgenomates group bacterium GW2011_GWA2_37_6]